MNIIIRFIPLILVLALGAVLYRGLSLDPKDIPSALVGKPVPEFSLTTLLDETKTVTNKDFKGDIVLLNVWATWCVYCKYEHPFLLDLAKNQQVSLYGLNYKDIRADATQWLADYGDPYVHSVFDESGSLGINLGVTAAPETFVIDHHGIIRKRFTGPIDVNIWQKEFADLIAEIATERQQGK